MPVDSHENFVGGLNLLNFNFLTLSSLAVPQLPGDIDKRRPEKWGLQDFGQSSFLYRKNLTNDWQVNEKKPKTQIFLRSPL